MQNKPEGAEQDLSAWKYIVTALLVIVAAFGLYALSFHDLPWGGPAGWGEFGDYFGGVTNPIFAFFSVILLSLTLRETRVATRRSEEAATLGKHVSGLDSAMAMWSRLLESHYHGPLSNANIIGPEIAMKLGDLLSLPEHTLSAQGLVRGGADDEDNTAWTVRYNRLLHVANILILIFDCLDEIDKVDSKGFLSKPYRVALAQPVLFLRACGHISETEAFRFTSARRLQPVGLVAG